ncbi:hypothetical protein EI94DRAFT_1622905, partial [Lactarius quietus]
DPTKSYNDFKTEMYCLYPGSSEDVSTVHHLDALIGKHTQLGIKTATELGDYHLDFKTISKYLIGKNHMSKAKQAQAFFRGFQPELEQQIRNWLQIVKPPHDPRDPYDLDDIYNVANYVLHQANLTAVNHFGWSAQLGLAVQLVPTPSMTIKSELQAEIQSALKSAVAKLGKMFKAAIGAQQNQYHEPLPPRMQGPLRPNGEGGSKCNFCGIPSHFMRECEIAAKYARMGKCKWNVENRIVLLSGAALPRSITGTWMRDRIDEYHRQNHGQMATTQMLLAMAGLAMAMVAILEEAGPTNTQKAVRFEPADEPTEVTSRELLSLAPETRNKMADATIRQWLTRTNAQVHMPMTFSKALREPSADAIIIANPYEAFLRSHPAGQEDKDIKVATESNSLRAILPIVDNQEKIEAILDPGCQIVAMSEEVCNALALPYNPNVRLNMVSANGGVNQSLGLAKNVPFLVGKITLYLQVHILRLPAYDILLGRPFNILTQSIVRNYQDENQTIMISDPNTSKKATVPTIACGSFCFAEKHKVFKQTLVQVSGF